MPGTVHSDVHARGIQQDRTDRHRAACRDDSTRQRRNESRRAGGDDYRHRRLAGRRHADGLVGDRDDARNTRCRADFEEPADGRHPDSRHLAAGVGAGRDPRRGRVVAGRPVSAHLSRFDCVGDVGGRDARQRRRRLGPVRPVPERRRGPGDQLQHRRRFGGDGTGWSPHQCRSTGRRQYLQGHDQQQLYWRRFLERLQLERRPHESRDHVREQDPPRCTTSTPCSADPSSGIASGSSPRRAGWASPRPPRTPSTTPIRIPTGTRPIRIAKGTTTAGRPASSIA